MPHADESPAAGVPPEDRPTTEGVPWINHAWLTDLLFYGLSQALGGVESTLGAGSLVVLKAVLIAVLAGLLIQIRRPGSSTWIPAACTAAALVAMSPRLLLQ